MCPRGKIYLWAKASGLWFRNTGLCRYCGFTGTKWDSRNSWLYIWNQMTIFPCTLVWCQCGGLASFSLNLCWHITKRANRTENKITCNIIFMTTYAVMWMDESSQKSCEMAITTSFLQLRRYDLKRKSDLLKDPSSNSCCCCFFSNNIVLLYKNKFSMVKVRVRVSWYFFTPLIDKVHALHPNTQRMWFSKTTWHENPKPPNNVIIPHLEGAQWTNPHLEPLMVLKV